MTPVTQFSGLDLIPNLLAGGAFLGAITFVAVYARYANWRATRPGKALMYWVIAFAALILMNTVHLATGRYPGIEFVRIVVYFSLGLAIWRLVWTLIMILWEGRPITLETFLVKKEGSLMSHAAPTLSDRIAEYRKAIAALAIPALVVVVSSLQGGSDGGTSITVAEWVTIVIAALGTSGLVAAVPNRQEPAPVAPVASDVTPPTL